MPKRLQKGPKSTKKFHQRAQKHAQNGSVPNTANSAKCTKTLSVFQNFVFGQFHFLENYCLKKYQKVSNIAFIYQNDSCVLHLNTLYKRKQGVFKCN
jgi:hypothetical protein